MNRYFYKDNSVISFSPIQYAQGMADGLTELMPEEVDEHLNPQPTPEQLADAARAERDAKLAKALERIDRYEKQSKTPDVTPDDSEDVYIAMLVYAQALRDVPEQPGFPENIDWPEVPTY